MTERYSLSDVERLSAILDDVIRDWDEPDRRLMHALFARAGAGGAGDDEVSGYDFSPGPGGFGQIGLPPDPCDNLFGSFQLGAGHQISPASRVELNPQPLPP